VRLFPGHASLRVRRLVLALHRWLGLTLGVYVVVIGVTGAVLVFEPELQQILLPQFFDVPNDGEILTDPAVVLHSVEAAYPGFRISSVNWPAVGRHSFVSYPSRAGDTRTVFLDPRTGAVLGELPTRGWLHWVRETHIYLLAGRTGLRASGIAACALVLLCLTGLVLWWPGVARSLRTLFPQAALVRRRPLFTLHSTLGAWTVVLLLLWAVTGVYFSFPREFRQLVALASPLTVRSDLPRSTIPVDAEAPTPEPAVLMARALAARPGAKPARFTVAMGATDPVVVVVAHDVVGDRVTSDEVSIYLDQYSGALLDVRPERGRTVGDRLMTWLFPLHTGRYGGLVVRLIWTFFGLTLPLLVATGTWMWWRKVAADR
jgi:uncharacterized iron-regulated membrane protein